MGESFSQWVRHPFNGCLVFIFGGIFLAVYITMGAYPVIMYWRASGWVETPCEITASEVDVYEYKDNEGYDETSQTLKIEYEYEFDGTMYTSNLYTPAKKSPRNNVPFVVLRYPAGSKRVCYVNPNNPKKAALVLSIDWFAWVCTFGPFVGAAVVFGGLFYITKFVIKDTPEQEAGENEDKTTVDQSGDDMMDDDDVIVCDN